MREERIEVGLGERAYPIIIREGLLEGGGMGRDIAARRVGNRLAVVADAHVASLLGRDLLDSLARAGAAAHLVEFPRGEESKSLSMLAELASRLARLGLDRKDAIVALGGGVSGDLAGFLAAVYMRGIPFVQVPTTLLAQVDSSVGGKTGVDIPEGKNLVGAFYQPRAVYIDPALLRTLPQEELLGGLAEVIKYGVIADADFFTFLERERERILALDMEVMARLIATCCRIKARVVAADEREGGHRRILNYGHTIGHAVEAHSGFTISHGMAVAMGMVAAARLARSQGLLEPAAAERIEALVAAYGLPTAIPAHMDTKRLITYMLADKKTVSGRITLVLPTAVGQVEITDRIDEASLKSIVEDCKA